MVLSVCGDVWRGKTVEVSACEMGLNANPTGC